MSDAQAVFISYILCVTIPPFAAAYLFVNGISQYSTMKSVKLGFSVLLLVLWMPLLMVAPQMFISYFYS